MGHHRSRIAAPGVLLALLALVALAAAPAALAQPVLPPVTGLTSTTHPSADVWYANASPSFSWVQSPLAAGYAFSIDQDASGDPGTSASAGVQVLPPASLFAAESEYACGATSWSGHCLALADLNRDGVLDAVVVDQYGNQIDVLDGDGSGGFETAVTSTLPTIDELPGEEAYYGPLSATVGDFNGDGWPDVAVALDACDPGYIVVALNQGDGTLGPWTPCQTGGSYPCDVASADLDGDGHVDLVVTDNFYWTSRVAVLLGNGDGTFQSAVTYDTDRAPVDLTVGDVNGDGHPDVVTANEGSEDPGSVGSISVLLGHGDGTLATAQTTGVAAPAEAIALTDLNGDGDLDAVVGQQGYVSTLLGKGDGTFDEPTDVSVPGDVHGLAAADYDGDGHTDVAVASDDGVGVLPGAGDGSLGTLTSYHSGYDAGIAATDLDGDGHGDLVFTDLLGDRLCVLPAAPPTVTAATGPLADGTWYFHVRSVDGDGDGGTVATLPVDIDTTAPTSTVDGLDDAWHGTDPVSVSLDASDPGYPDAGGVTGLELRLLWGGEEVLPWMSDELPIVDGAIHFDDSWGGLPDGVWTIETRATDAAGNVETGHGYTMKVDTTAPTVGLSGVSDGATYTSPQTAVLTASDPLPSPPSFDGSHARTGSFARALSALRAGAALGGAARPGEPAPEAESSGVASVSWRWGSTGAFTPVTGDTASIPIGLKPAGQRTVEYYSTDVAGNCSKTASFTVTIRAAKPRVTGLGGATVVRGGLAHLRYRLTDTSYDRLSCRLFVTQYGHLKLNRSLGAQPVGTTLSAPLHVTLKPGVYSWRVKATDAAGGSGWSTGRCLIVVAHEVS